MYQMYKTVGSNSVTEKHPEYMPLIMKEKKKNDVMTRYHRHRVSQA